MPVSPCPAQVWGWAGAKVALWRRSRRRSALFGGPSGGKRLKKYGKCVTAVFFTPTTTANLRLEIIAAEVRCDRRKSKSPATPRASMATDALSQSTDVGVCSSEDEGSVPGKLTPADEYCGVDKHSDVGSSDSEDGEEAAHWRIPAGRSDGNPPRRGTARHLVRPSSRGAGVTNGEMLRASHPRSAAGETAQAREPARTPRITPAAPPQIWEKADIVHVIFTWLLSMVELGRCCCVCRIFREGAGSDALWERHYAALADGKVFVPGHVTAHLDRREFRLAARCAVIDSRRLAITHTEVAATVWHTRSKDKCRTGRDPWWRYQPARRVRYRPDGRVVDTCPPAAQADVGDCELGTWHFAASYCGFASPGRFLRVRDLEAKEQPTQVMFRHPGNWGW